VAVVPEEAVSGTAAARRYPEEVAVEWARRASMRRIRNSSSQRRRSSTATALRRATEVHLHRRRRVDMAQEAPHRRRMPRLEVMARRLTFSSSSSDLDTPVQSTPRHRRARRSMATTAPRRSLSRPVTPVRRTVSLSPKVRMSLGVSCSEYWRVRSRGSDDGQLAAAPATQAQRPAFRARLPHT
jgi:hypothetical protein